MSRHHSCGGARSRSLAKSTSICRALALRRTRGEAQAMFREGFLPIADMGVVELIRRHEMPNCPELSQLLGSPAIEFDRRMKEELSVREACHGHPGGKRYRQPHAADGEIFQWAVNDADIWR